MRHGLFRSAVCIADTSDVADVTTKMAQVTLDAKDEDSMVFNDVM